MNKPRLWPVIVTFLAASLAIVVGGTILLIGLLGREGLRNPPPFTARMLILSLLVTQVVLVASALIAGRPFSPKRFRLERGPSLRFLAAAAVGALALATALDSSIILLGLSNTGSLPELRRALAGATGPSLAAAILLVGPLTGFAEELFFRGFMQTRFAERWTPGRAVLVTSVCFGLLHMDLVHTPVAFVMGLWLGHVTERSGSLIPAIAAHVLNNALSVILLVVGAYSEDVTFNVALLVGAVAILIPCGAVVGRRPAAPAPVPAPMEMVQGF